MPSPPHFAISASQLPHSLSSIALYITRDVLEVLGAVGSRWSSRMPTGDSPAIPHSPFQPPRSFINFRNLAMDVPFDVFERLRSCWGLLEWRDGGGGFPPIPLPPHSPFRPPSRSITPETSQWMLHSTFSRG
ncbi:hypothetical protein M422DRAFT_247692 [Sphaerobolus stellatus SS14]|nr:hypothetical protein M422DRAFT_247692 [Sphaerobolus stellatus SS14]